MIKKKHSNPFFIFEYHHIAMHKSMIHNDNDEKLLNLSNIYSIQLAVFPYKSMINYISILIDN